MSISNTSPLGKPVGYVGRYDRALLHSMPRAEGRARLGLGAALPFTGFDVWNAYELSWLDLRGKPDVALATFLVSADTPAIVESKSLKLYLNSFAQTPFVGVEAVREAIARDLARAFGGPVAVTLKGRAASATERIADLAGECIDDLDVAIDRYTPDPSLLSASGGIVEETLVSNLLRSNCPVTGQPDWGSVQVHYRGPRIERAGLLRYIVSFRAHQDFHEHCVERMFVDLMTRTASDRLSVYARYTRRGGIDINPFRSNFETVLPANVRTPRQ